MTKITAMEQDGRIPPELLRPPPRMLRRRSSDPGAWALTILSCLICAVPVALLAFSAGEAVLLSTSPIVTATIDRMYATRGSKGGTKLHAAYHLIDPTGRTVATTQGLSSFYNLNVNQPAPARWMTVGPWKTSELDVVGQHLFSERWLLWMVTAFSNGILLSAIVARQRQKSLLRSGTPIIGKVISRSKTRGRTTSYWLRVEYAPQGRSLIQNFSVPSVYYNRNSEGSLVCLIYWPTWPRRSMLYHTSRLECVAARSDPAR